MTQNAKLIPFAVITAIALCCFTEAAAQRVFAGRVIDTNGTAEKDAEISSVWLFGTSDGHGARAYGSVRSDELGRFSLPMPGNSQPAELLVYSADRRMAAAVHVRPGQDRLEIRLHPVADLYLSAHAPRLGTKLRGTRFLLETPEGSVLGQLLADNVTFPCPPGDYQLLLSSSETAGVKVPVHIRTAEPVGLRVRLTLSALANRYGKPPLPLTGLVDINGRAVAAPVFDRPTLIYFWADWCQPCIAEGIPRLMQFMQQHHGERFQIFAVHENGIPMMTSAKAFQQSLAHLQSSVWYQTLSFPSTFDVSGNTTAAWGLSTFPTYVLVNGQGNLQRDAGLDQLEQLVK